ncbi:MAG: SusC/RagA family TonB-linked outer membrane protein, partial [Bacteroidales bacterium]
ISGKVTDSNGQPLPGVTVVEKGSTNGTITDVDGKYILVVSSEAKSLTFSFVGMKTEELAIAGKKSLNIALKEDAIGLDEVVAVGYGVQKKSDVTGALSSVSAKDLVEMPVKDALQGMQGKAAGVYINNSQRPGAVGSIQIRGTRSITASNSPLYVVDGMIIQSGGIENINPNDIESIDVLKDASATAVYGSRGANGVVLVTTKSGKAGKVTVSYSGSATISTMHDVMEMMGTAEWLDYDRAGRINAGTYGSDVPSYAGDLAAYGAAPSASFANIASGWIENNTVWDSSKAGQYDWSEHGKQTGIAQDHSLSISGGNDKFKGYASFGYFNQKGAVIGQEFTRYTSKLSFEATSNWFTMGANANVSMEDQDYGYSFSAGVTGAGDYYSALRNMAPWTVPYDENGEFIREPYIVSTTVNPMNELQYTTNIRETFRLSGSLYSEVNFGKIWQQLDGLKYRVQFGPEYRNYMNGTFADERGVNGGGNNVARRREDRRIAWTIDNMLMYNKTLFEVHNLGFTLLQSAQKYHHDGSNIRAYVATSDELWYNLSSGGNIQSAGTSLSENQMSSYMIRGNYSFADKYLLTASVRWDGASQLADGNKWASFPSLALGWRMDQENFMQNANWVDQLKLRFGYGQTGNAAVGAYSTKGAASGVYGHFGSGSELGLVTTDPKGKNQPSMANKDLGWERTIQFNYGLDYAALSRRVSGSFDFYTTNTKDLLLTTIIPGISGYTSTTSNAGETKGWGVELQLNTINVKTNDFEWSTNLTWSRNENEVVLLANNLDMTTVANKSDSNFEASTILVGENINIWYDYVYDGIWGSDEAAEAAKHGAVPGMIRVKDLNEDGKIDANNDRAVIGNKVPKWNGGITNIFTYKNLELSFFIYGSYGGLTPRGNMERAGYDYWIAGENEGSRNPMPGISNGDFSTSNRYADASYLKMRNVNLGYTFSNTALERVGISSLKLYAQAINPFTIYSGIDYLDPDLRDYNTDKTGTSFNGSPVTVKSYVFGIRASF